jgi:hypothetical protein
MFVANFRRSTTAGQSASAMATKAAGRRQGPSADIRKLPMKARMAASPTVHTSAVPTPCISGSAHRVSAPVHVAVRASKKSACAMRRSRSNAWMVAAAARKSAAGTHTCVSHVRVRAPADASAPSPSIRSFALSG